MTGIPAEDPSADRPNIARVYDYLLAQIAQFRTQRAFAQLLAQWPEARDDLPKPDAPANRMRGYAGVGLKP